MILDKPLVPINVLAARLSVSVPTVRYWINRGLLPLELYVRIGQTYRFDADAIVEHFRNKSEAPQLPLTVVEDTGLTHEEAMDILYSHPKQLPDPKPRGETADPQPTRVTLEDIFANEGENHDN